MKRALLPLALVTLVSACNKDPNDMAIKDVSPRAGATQVEQVVTITGHFRDDLGYTVFFGPRRASAVTVRDPSTLMAKCPTTDEAGAVDITIMADNGIAYRIHDGYTYQQAGGGNVMENVGEGPARREGAGGNLAY